MLWNGKWRTLVLFTSLVAGILSPLSPPAQAAKKRVQCGLTQEWERVPDREISELLDLLDLTLMFRHLESNPDAGPRQGVLQVEAFHIGRRYVDARNGQDLDKLFALLRVKESDLIEVTREMLTPESDQFHIFQKALRGLYGPYSRTRDLARRARETLETVVGSIFDHNLDPASVGRVWVSPLITRVPTVVLLSAAMDGSQRELDTATGATVLRFLP